MMLASLERSRARRELLGLLVAREVRSRYLGNVMGWFWLLINPLAQLAVYGLVFSVVLSLRYPGDGPQNVTLFIALGLWPWLAFQEATLRATAALEEHRELLRKAAFPRAYLIYAAVLGVHTVHGCGYLAVLAILAATTGAIQPVGLVAVAGVWICQALLAAGLALALAPLQLMARDLRHMLPAVFTIWFYATPIVYPLMLVPPDWQALLWFNPATHLMVWLRRALLEGAAGPTVSIAMVALGCLIVFLIGRACFRHSERWVEDFL